MPGSTPRPFSSQGLAQRRLRPKQSWVYGGQWQGPQQIATSGQTSVTLDFTASPAGEWCFAFVGLSDSQVTPPTAPTGWSILLQGAESASGAASSRLIVYTRLKQAGDTTTAFTWGTACGFSALPVAWYGLDQTTPTEGAIYLAHSSGTTYPTGTVTPTAADRWIAGVFYNRTTTSTGSWISDPGMTERYAVASAANPWSLLEIADTGIAVTAAGHTYTSTSSVSSSHGGSIAFALIPATPFVAVTTTEPLVVSPTFTWLASSPAMLFGPGAPTAVVTASASVQPLVVSPSFTWPQVPVPTPGAQISASQPLGNPAVGSPQPLVVGPPWTPVPIPGARISSPTAVAVTRSALVVTPPYTPVPIPLNYTSASQPLGNPAVGSPQPLVVGPPFATVPVPGAIVSVNPAAPLVSNVGTPQPLVVTPPYTPVPVPLNYVSASQPLGNPAVGSPQPLVVTPTFTLAPVPGARVFAVPAAPVVVATSTPQPLVVGPPSTVVPVPGVRLFASPPQMGAPQPLVVTPPFRPVPIPGADITSSQPLGNPAVATRSALVVTPPWRPVAIPKTYLSAGVRDVAVVDCFTHRPSTGTTTRPSSGITARATSTTTRPNTGTTTRPNTGQTDPPCGA